MKVLIAGGLGFLGARLAQMLARTSDHAVVLGTRRSSAPPVWAADSLMVRTDWQSDSALALACAGVQAVVHAAGMNARACERDPVAALEVHGVATARLVRAAVRQRVARFIYVSTAHVYGAALTGAVDERTCPRPQHPYATSRRAAEDVVMSECREGGTQPIIVRLSNAFGAPVDPEADCWSLLTNDLCLQAVRARRLHLSTVGSQRRDFIALSEVCRALTHLLTVRPPAVNDCVVNVGSGWAPTALEMANLIATRTEALLGFRPSVQTGTHRDPVASGPLEYGVRRLLDSGFEPRPEAVIEEMDELIRFCVHFDEVIRR